MDFAAIKKSSPKQLVGALERRLRSYLNPQRYTSLPAQPQIPAAVTKLIIGPANFAGQGFGWAREAERAVPDLYAESLTRTIGVFGFPTDDEVSTFRYQFPKWQKRESDRITSNFTHVLIEAGRPITGSYYGRTVDKEISIFTKAGLSCAVVSHGSDTRIPSNHVAKYPYSPFAEAPKDVVETLENRAQTLVTLYSKLDIPIFVSTPDLIDDLPNGIWLPVVVDKNIWATPLTVSGRKLRVLYAPSNSWIKGGPKVDQVLQGMSDRGQVEYQRITGIPANEMPSRVKKADIVIDQFALGAYGTMAVQAMAAGKVVVGHVAPWVRDRIPAEVPIIESSVDQLEEVILNLVSNEELRREVGANGERFVTEFHNGSYSGAVLKSWIRPGT